MQCITLCKIEKATVVLILQVECTEKLKQNIDTVQSETYIENSRT